MRENDVLVTINYIKLHEIFISSFQIFFYISSRVLSKCKYFGIFHYCKAQTIFQRIILFQLVVVNYFYSCKFLQMFTWKYRSRNSAKRARTTTKTQEKETICNHRWLWGSYKVIVNVYWTLNGLNCFGL